MKYELFNDDCLIKMKDIPNNSIDLILCDLPYGTTACKWDIIIPFEPLWNEYNRIIKKNGAIVLFGSEPFSSKLRISNLKMYKYDWIWNKKKGGNPFLAKKQPLKSFENIIVFNSKIYYPQMTKGKMREKGKCKRGYSEIFGNLKEYYNKNDLYYPVAILEFSNSNQTEKIHPTQKPVELLEYLIKTYTNENELVLDNCMGSGSTGVACINTNRNFIGIELNENYFNLAKERIDTAFKEKEVAI